MIIQTNRLQLVPATKEFVRLILTDKERASHDFQFNIPQNWPEKDLLDFLPSYLRILEIDSEELGFGVWIIIDRHEQKIVGDAGFKGKPNQGMVEIGYSILPEYRRRGYAFEAVDKLTDWVFKQKHVKRITAECYEDNIPSIRILQKVGMKEVNKENGIIYWEKEIV